MDWTVISTAAASSKTPVSSEATASAFPYPHGCRSSAGRAATFRACQTSSDPMESARDSIESAISAVEHPTMPATSFAAARRMLATSPIKVFRCSGDTQDSILNKKRQAEPAVSFPCG